MATPHGQPETGLWDRDFKVYLFGRTISELGSRITREGLPITAVLTVHATAQDLGWMAALAYVAALLGAPLAGVLTDRMRRRPILVAADLIRACLLASITLGAVLGLLTFLQMLIVFGLVAGVSVFFDVADQAWLPAFAGRVRLEGANAALSGAAAVGETGGPLLMGSLVQALGGPFAMLVDAGSYCVSAFSLLLVRRSEPPPQPRVIGSSTLSEAGQGMRALFGHPVLRPLALALATQSLAGGFFSALYEFFALRDVHLSPFAIGLLVTGGGLGALLGSALAPRLSLWLGAGRTLFLSALLYGVLSLLVPLAPTAPGLAFLFLLLAQLLGDSAGTVFEVGEAVMRQSLTPDAWLGRVSGAVRFLGNLLGALGAVLAGTAAATFGVRPTLLVAAAVFIAAALWLLRPAVRRLARPPGIDAGHFATHGLQESL